MERRAPRDSACIPERPSRMRDPLRCYLSHGRPGSQRDAGPRSTGSCLNTRSPRATYSCRAVSWVARRGMICSESSCPAASASWRSAVPPITLCCGALRGRGAGVVIGYRVSALKDIATSYERLGAVQYHEQPPVSTGHVIFKDEGNLHVLLLIKASYWSYEQEWRLTLELKNMVGTGKTDPRGYSVNLCPIPNEAVADVLITERTPNATVSTIEARLSDPSNRYRASGTRKLFWLRTSTAMTCSKLDRFLPNEIAVLYAPGSVCRPWRQPYLCATDAGCTSAFPDMACPTLEPGYSPISLSAAGLRA